MAIRIIIPIVTAALALAQAPVTAQSTARADSLRLADVYALVDARNPMLAAFRSRADAVRSMESSATLPPDPQLRLGVMNASLPGLKADMPTSMAPAVELMQMVPLPGKLSLTGEIARQESAVAQAEAAEAAWMLRARAAMSFYDIYDVDRQLASMLETLRILEDYERVARAMYSAGEGRQSDVLRAGVEGARIRAEIERMQAMREVAAARLNGLLDRPADTLLPPPAVPVGAVHLPSADTLRGWAAASRPLLHEGRAVLEQASARTGLARRELWPDVTVGLQYGQRDAGAMGTERMGSLMLGVSLPVFASRRQLQMRRAAAAMEQMAASELADARAQVEASIGELLAQLGRTGSLAALYRAEVLPQAQATVQSSLSSYRVGAVDFMTLVDARMTLSEFERELYRLEAEHGQLVAELEMTIGRELPHGDAHTLEER